MKTALLKSSGKDLISRKICGLYLLERNIIVLDRSGFKKVFLDLSEDERDFYEKEIKKYVKKANIEIITDKKAKKDGVTFTMPSNIFIQQHYFDENNEKKYFTKKGKNFIPLENEEIFTISDDSEIKRAIDKITGYIIENTGGFIAQKINKRISIPISKVVSKTRIHPNYLTIMNMLIGWLSSVMVFLCTFPNFSSMEKYYFMLAGGFLFQAASILDGVDGEVAKLTLKVSKLGGWIDTIGDNSTLLFFLLSCSYLFYTMMGGTISIITIGVLFAGLAVMLSIMVSFLSKYSDSGSLVAYDREFLQKLPKEDKLVQFALNMKYLTKKEMFSIVFFALGVAGIIEMVVPMASFVLLAGALILTGIHFKYMKKFAAEKAKSKN